MSSTKTIDPSLKANWLAALRDGAYRQAQGVLQDSRGCHCCLGVLADITDRSQWSSDLEFSEEADQGCYFYDGEAAMVQREFLTPLGLSMETALRLASMNDSGASFREIADWIEANL